MGKMGQKRWRKDREKAEEEDREAKKHIIGKVRRESKGKLVEQKR